MSDLSQSTARAAAGCPAVSPVASPLTSLGRTSVSVAGGLLERWQRRNREQTVPHTIEQLRLAGNLDNFRSIVDGATVPYRGRYPFLDTDVYKTLEGVVYELARGVAGQEVRDFYEEAVDLVERAQRPDGYLNTHFQADSIGKAPWSDLSWGHELYTLGHLVQAAVCANRQLGDDRLLRVAVRFSDLVWERFGPDTEHTPAFCGHPEVEMALVELCRETGDRRYLELADLMVRRRGHQTIESKIFTSEYFQDLVPFVELDSVIGHAVRMTYLASGATDVAVETGAEDLRTAVLRLWDDMVASKLYITGGLGSRHTDEAVGDRFELPSERAYNETCAAIALMQWAWRMLLATGEARFADVFETVLYNAFAVGVSDDGCSFFYDNPLQRRHDHLQRTGAEGDGPLLRRGWFVCPCCPPNIVRWVSQLQDHVAAADEDTLYVATLTSATISHRGLDLAIEGDYPWDGDVRVSVRAAEEGGPGLAVRVPAWARTARVTRNGEAVAVVDGWARLRDLREGDHVHLALDLRPRAHGADPRVDAVRGSLAVVRGPIVYCAEQQDNETDLDELLLTPDDVQLLEPVVETIVDSGPTVVLRGAVGRAPIKAGGLYPELTAGTDPVTPWPGTSRTNLTLVPYFQWGNREARAMRVWLRTV